MIVNTRDAMWQVDGLIELGSTIASLACTQTSLAEDLEIWASEEFGYVELGSGYARTSVLMPQKRNPYALSMIRGMAGVLIGRLTGLVAVQKSPSARSDSLIMAYGEVPAMVDEARRTTETDGRRRGDTGRERGPSAADARCRLHPGHGPGRRADGALRARLPRLLPRRRPGAADPGRPRASARELTPDLLDAAAVEVLGAATGQSTQVTSPRSIRAASWPPARLPAVLRRRRWMRWRTRSRAVGRRCSPRPRPTWPASTSPRRRCGNAAGRSRGDITDGARDQGGSRVTDTGHDVIPTLPEDVAVVNVGLPMFADAVAAQGRAVASVDWRIPAGGEPELVAALARLYGRRSRPSTRPTPRWCAVSTRGCPSWWTWRRPGRSCLGSTGGPSSCGPPLDYADACDPLRRSMRAAVVAEGWATTREDADRMLGDGQIRLDAANAHDLVVPMVTALGPSQPVWVAVLDGRPPAFAPLNQGPGETPWFGRETDAAIDRLRFLADAAGPVLAEALRTHGPIDALGLAAQGVQMGDDAHIRVQATTNLLLRNLLPHLVASDHPARVEVARFLSSNHLFFLTAGMAAARALTGWAAEVTGSSIVTTMSRNGTELGIKLAGSDDWHLTEAPPIGQALYYAGQGPDTSARTWGTARCSSSSASAVRRPRARRPWRRSWGVR